jgi:recombinational DNA repair protein (RecF pathway)
MLEYVTEAVVLDKVDLKEQDLRVFLFTKDFGKVIAKMTSGRKITSKLNGHLEPSSLTTVKIVDKNSPQIIDALMIKKVNIDKILSKILFLVKEISPENQSEPLLWDFLVLLMDKEAEEKDFIEALRILGFDPKHAKCNNCLKGSPNFFSIKDLAFYCKNCY